MHVHILSEDRDLSEARNSEGVAQLCEQFITLAPSLIVVGGTGGFEEVVTSARAAAYRPLAGVNPRQIRDFARGKGHPAKTDTIVTAVIARFAGAVRPKPRATQDVDAVMLGKLVARQRPLTQMMAAKPNLRSRLTRHALLKVRDRQLAQLQKQLPNSRSMKTIWIPLLAARPLGAPSIIY